MIRLYRMAPDVTVLGPGRRFCLWVQGCDRHCHGCMSPETWDPAGGTLWQEEALAAQMLRFDFEGVTISGGEPFLQASSLARLLQLLRAERDIGVIVYTGFELEQLRGLRDSSVDALLAMTDLLIDGPYQQELDDDGALRGSSNQKARLLTERYAGLPENGFGQIGHREQQWQIDEQGILIIGLRHPGTPPWKAEKENGKCSGNRKPEMF